MVKLKMGYVGVCVVLGMASTASALPLEGLQVLEDKQTLIKEVEAQLPTGTSTTVVKRIEDAATKFATKAEDASDEKAKNAREAAIAEIRSGKFIEYGVTGGLAFLVQFPLFSRELGGGYQLDSFHAVTVAPYVALVPAYWFYAPETQKYCASKWTKSEVDAQKAADELARSRAALIVDDLVVGARGGGTREDQKQAVARAVEAVTASAAADRARLVELVLSATSTDTLVAARAEAAAVVLVAKLALDWKTGVRARCWGAQFGAWATLAPTAYDATVARVSGGTKVLYEDVSFDRYVSFGFAWVPTAYASVLVGLSYAEAELREKQPDGADKLLSPLDYWAVSLGLSLNVDIATIFTK